VWRFYLTEVIQKVPPSKVDSNMLRSYKFGQTFSEISSQLSDATLQLFAGNLLLSCWLSQGFWTSEIEKAAQEWCRFAEKIFRLMLAPI